MRADDVRALLTSTGVTRCKLCGMSRPEDVQAANDVGCDLVGFVVDFPRSHRSVEASDLAALTAGVDPQLVRVGVFVDEPADTVRDLFEAGAIDAAQLHGHEDEAYLARLRELSDVPTIQAFVVRDEACAARAEASSADLVLLDGGKGAGRRFDWSLVSKVRRPFLLAGGLGPDNVGEAVRACSPWGVDMSSSLERDGHKDKELMAAAVAAVRSMR